MCGRYTLGNVGQLSLRFNVAVDETPDLVPRYNVAPTEQVPVVVERADQRVLQTMRWGFQPVWLSEDRKAPAPINARAETLLERPLFRSSLPRHRCLIPADGFYEWQAQPGGRTKQPYYIHLRDGSVFALAGLYTQGPSGMADASCVIITTAANELMAPLHDRMPVILPRDAEAAWLDPGLQDTAALLTLLRQYPAERMEAYPVSRLVSSVRNDGPALIEPFQHA
jgi:putative SOS response-associated peptidase YedK